MAKRYQRLRLILGDQLNARHSWFRQKDETTLYLLAELHQEATYVTHHVQKICAFFAAMSAFATALKGAGHEVLHLDLDDTQDYPSLPALLEQLIAKYEIQHLDYQLPDEYRLRQQLASFAEDSAIDVSVFESEHFFLRDNELREHFTQGKRHQMEAFYRRMRVRFHVLMADDSSPEGGQWNHDQDNRNKLKKEDLKHIPQPLMFANDVSHILERLQRHEIKTMGQTSAQLPWPTNRQQAIDLLEHFCRHGLPRFGYFQDAMTGKLESSDQASQWSLYHSRLSFALNSKMLDPQRVINSAIAHYRDPQTEAINIAQIEGFVRQILGWREFVRGIYWANMPDYAGFNALSAERELPSWFWSAKTNMRCLQQSISQSLDFAYAHHIQRLMITGNFCLLAGIHPDQVDQWYMGIYIDAIEWVELPNTRGMSQFADGGIVGSKAYAASGNYVNKMSDYCADCTYQVKQISEPSSCPLNSLYWHFMSRHEADFSDNPRNRMVYANWHKKTEEQRSAILKRAEALLADIEQL